MRSGSRAPTSRTWNRPEGGKPNILLGEDDRFALIDVGEFLLPDDFQTRSRSIRLVAFCGARLQRCSRHRKRVSRLRWADAEFSLGNVMPDVVPILIRRAG